MKTIFSAVIAFLALSAKAEIYTCHLGETERYHLYLDQKTLVYDLIGDLRALAGELNVSRQGETVAAQFVPKVQVIWQLESKCWAKVDPVLNFVINSDASATFQRVNQVAINPAVANCNAPGVVPGPVRETTCYKK